MALSDDHLTTLLALLGVSPGGQAIIQKIRSSPPSRLVQGGRGNVCVRYPSHKMGVTIQAESHKVELAYIYEMEHDPDVLEYFDQPPRIKLKYQHKNGRTCAFYYTADFFVIGKAGAGWVECKSEDELLRLAEEQPTRYVRDADGWHCPPGESYAEQFGLFYRLWSSSEIDPIRMRNLICLDECLWDEDWSADSPKCQQIINLVREQPGITLRDLRSQVGMDHIDDIFRLIATRHVYVDLSSSLLTEPTYVQIYQDANIAAAYQYLGETLSSPKFKVGTVPVLLPGQVLEWDGKSWTVVNTGEHEITLIGERGVPTELPVEWMTQALLEGKVKAVAQLGAIGISDTAARLIASASPKHIAIANDRYRYMEYRKAGRTPPPSVRIPSERTYHYWRASYREAEEVYGCGYVGLLPQYAYCGNRCQLPEDIRASMVAYIDREYATLKQKSSSVVYKQFVRECEANGIEVPSYQTFVQAIKGRPRYEQTKKRAGKRAAYKHKPFVWRLSLDTPRHGDRPYEVCHIDHTRLDIELVCSKTGLSLGRPWLTFMMCAYSRRILAIYLTFDSPSYRSCMMVLRECVRRHNRLPQIIVVDGGPEFRSIYFEQLLAYFGVAKKTRPRAEPRFGGVIERVFGTTNTTFVHNLAGNTQLTKQVRQVTKGVNPKGQAVWSLEHLYARLCQWGYEVYDTQLHTTLGQTPREVFVAGIAKSGISSSRLILYDDAFRLLTLPSTRRGKAKIQPNRGVKLNNIYYWADEMRAVGVESTTVPVRYDPWDMGTAYVYITQQGQSRWIKCLSHYYTIFAGRSEPEIKIATEELRARNQRLGQRREVSMRELAEFLSSVEAEESELRVARQRALGIREVNKLINSDFQTSVSSPSTPLLQDRDNEEEAANAEPTDAPAPTTQHFKVFGDF